MLFTLFFEKRKKTKKSIVNFIICIYSTIIIRFCRRVVFVRGHCTYIVHLIFVKEGRHILTWERVARDKLFFNIVKSGFILK